MKKELAVFMLTAVLVLCTALPVRAYTADEKNTADALYQMDLFLGYGSSYGLDDSLTRYQGYVLLVRMLGKEEEAKTAGYSHPFTDVKANDPYIAYAYHTGLTKGISKTEFNADGKMDVRQFAVVCLRSLGYSDNAGGDFTFKGAETFAKEHGISIPTGSFDRGLCVKMFWNTLHTSMKGSTQTLADELIERGVISASDLSAAERIQRSGITADDKTGEKGKDTTGETTTEGGNTGGEWSLPYIS